MLLLYFGLSNFLVVGLSPRVDFILNDLVEKRCFPAALLLFERCMRIRISKLSGGHPSENLVCVCLAVFKKDKQKKKERNKVLPIFCNFVIRK